MSPLTRFDGLVALLIETVPVLPLSSEPKPAACAPLTVAAPAESGVETCVTTWSSAYQSIPNLRPITPSILACCSPTCSTFENAGSASAFASASKLSTPRRFCSGQTCLLRIFRALVADVTPSVVLKGGPDVGPKKYP